MVETVWVAQKPKARSSFSLIFFPMTILAVIFTLISGCNHQYSSDGDIFVTGSQWVYVVTTLDSSKSIMKSDTITLTVEKGSFLVRQKKISWSIKNKLPDGSTEEIKEITGVVENKDRIWLHPPRFDYLKFTELTAFPEIKFPINQGKTWTSTLHIGAGWGKWKGEKVSSTYEIKGVNTKEMKTQNSDSCYLVSAVSKSKLGVYKTTYCFNLTTGFEYINYEHPDGTLTNITLKKRVK